MSLADNLFQLAFGFLEQEPKAAARLLEKQSPQAVADFLVNTKTSLVVRLLQEMQDDFCGQVLLATPNTELTLWLADTPNNTIAAVCRRLSAQQQNDLLAVLSSKKQGACQLLLNYHPDMIGAWIETDVPVFPGDMSVEEVLSRLKKYSFKEGGAVFAVDDSRQLLGVVAPLELVRSSKSLDLATLTSPCKTVLSGRSQITTVVRHSIWQQQDYVPIVNRHKEFIGIVRQSRLRSIVPREARYSRFGGKQSGNAIFEVFHAHGESMRALVDVLGRGIR